MQTVRFFKTFLVICCLVMQTVCEALSMQINALPATSTWSGPLTASRSGVCVCVCLHLCVCVFVCDVCVTVTAKVLYTFLQSYVSQVFLMYPLHF